MASESELADLYLTLRAVTAPMLKGFEEVSAAGAEMVTALAAELTRIDEQIAATAESLAGLRAGMAAGAETGMAAAAGTGAAGAATVATEASTGAATASIAGNEALAASEKEVSEAAATAAGVWVDAQGRMRDSEGRFVTETTSGADAVLAAMHKEIAGFDEATAAMARERKEAAALGRDTEALGAGTSLYAAQATDANAKVGASMDDTSKRAKMAAKPWLMVAAGAAVAGVAALKMAANYQQSTVRLVTSAGESAKAVTSQSGQVVGGLKYVQEGILQLAGEVGFSAKDLSTAMYTIESGGMHGAKGLSVLKAAAQGAKTENADLTTVADAVTTAMTDYGKKAGSAAQVTSKLVAATGQGKTTFQDLAGSMSAILPKAAAAHIGLDEILGDIASMTLHGISARQATQNLANAVDHMQRPTMAMSKEMAALGLNSTQLSQHLGQRGLAGTIGVISDAIHKRMGSDATSVILKMQDALAGLPPKVQQVSQGVLNGTESWADWNAATKTLNVTQRSQAQSFATLVNGMHTIGTEQLSGGKVMQTYAGALGKAMGTTDGLNVALMLTGQNTNNTSKSIGAISKATQTASGDVRGWSEIQGTFNQKMSQAKDGSEALAISVGMKLLPAATKILGVLASGVQWLTRHKAVATVLAITLGVVLVGALTMAMLAMAKLALGMVTGPIKAFANGGKAVWNFASDLGGGLAGAEAETATFGSRIGSALNTMGSALGRSASSAAQWATGVGRRFITTAASAVRNAAVTAAAWVASGVKMASNAVAQAAVWAANMARQFLATAVSAARNAAATSAAWLAENAVMIGQGLAQLGTWALGMATKFTAVAITAGVEAGITAAAWIAANIAMIAATGGILLAIGLIVAGAVYVITHWKQVKEFLSGIGKWIVGLFTGAGEWLKHAGEAILKGFLDGLLNAWNAVKNFVSGIGSWIADHKGPVEYDRTLLTPHGNAIMQGLLSGLKTGGKQVSSYLDAFTQGLGNTSLSVGGGGLSVGGSLAPGLPGGLAGGGGGVMLGQGAVQITVLGSVQTEQNLVRAVQQGILQLSGRNSGFGLTPAFQ